MPAVLIAGPESLSGKTTVTAALGRRLADTGRRVALWRLAGDANAAADARLLGGLAFNAGRRSEPLEAAALGGEGGGSLGRGPAAPPLPSVSVSSASSLKPARWRRQPSARWRKRWRPAAARSTAPARR